jgi:hypothetical protein
MSFNGLIKKIGILTFCTCLSPFSAYGEWSSTAGTVRNIYSNNGTVLIDTNITDGPCGEGKGFWWPITDNDSDVMLSLVLSALSTEKRIKVVYTSSNPECFTNRAKITHLLLLGN